ncbi:MAG: SMC-Scp complex subunit ScpB [Spirochaetaceae bacterium]|nr:MAG: SMC-Scp complex subunit ScpB [Spirochaetaceae bacterium]
MQLEREQALLESILFLEGEPLEERALARIAGLPIEIVRACLETMTTARRDDPGSGLEVSRVGEAVSLVPKHELWDQLKERYGRRNENRLSRAAMETLSIVAYSQPITRAEVESLRGVSADGMIRLLLSRELIREVGKKDAPGRPVQYGTTRRFLQLFRLNSIADLPKLDQIDEERFTLDG